MSTDGLEGTRKYFGLYEGTVIEVDKGHRVRANLPGLCAQSAWARPRTLAGGPSRGGHMAPQVGDPVLVQFIAGVLTNPIYEGGPWTTKDGQSKIPTDIDAAGSGGDQVSVLEFNRGRTSIRLTVDERTGHRSFRVTAVERPLTGNGPETVIGSIELDVEQRVLDLYALAGVQVRSLGFVDVRALAARIQYRRVRRTAAPL